MTNEFDKTDTRTTTDKKLNEWAGENAVDTAGSGGPKAPDTPAVQSLEQEQDRQAHKSEGEKLNDALEESFPASDPVSHVTTTTASKLDKDEDSK